MTQSTSSPGLIAAPRWQRISWPSMGAVLTAEASTAVAGLSTAALGGPHWAAATAALAVGGGALARYRGTSAAERLVDRLSRRGPVVPRVHAAPYPGGGEIGISRTPEGLTALIRIAPSAPRLVSMLENTEPALPLGVLTELLAHIDTPARRVDVVLRGGRTPGVPTAPRLRYQQLLGAINRWAVADLVIAVTIDPADCAAACARRGGGEVGELRVAALAAHRAVDALRSVGIASTPLRPAAVETFPPLPTDGVAIDPDEVVRGDLGALFAADAPGDAMLTLRTDGRGGVRVAAMRSRTSLDPDPRRVSTEVSGPIEAVAALRVPRDGCGQVLGSDAAGGPVSVRLHGPGVRTVWAAVADDPALQLVERAVATGARVLVVTGRPGMWRLLVSWVASPEHLWISGWNPPAGAAPIDPAEYTVTVLDGTAAGLPPGSHEPTGTVWRIEQAGISPVIEADVVLSQPSPGMLTVRTDGAAAALRLVA